MYTFKTFLIEELHPEIKSIMDSDIPLRNKLSQVTTKLRVLSHNNIDSGVLDNKPKKGSSRAVFVHKEPEHIVLDGTPTKLKTVTKIAFHGKLDKYKKSDEPLLGEAQNEVESVHFARRHYAIIIPKEYPSTEYETNHESGILAPVLDNHEDHHWLHMGHVENMKKSDFSKLTKNENFPKGMNFDKFHRALMDNYNEGHGKSVNLQEEHDEIMSHPLTQKVIDFCGKFAQHPADLVTGNWGIFHHPITGEKYPVIRDYGYSSHIAKMYSERRNRERQKLNWL